jgi:serine/threonine-protein kinase
VKPVESAKQVRSALEKLLASDQFSGSPRLARFLRFAVEKTLAGEGGDLKEYLLGTEVFDRGADFDPRIDPIVRVEARRLRSKLKDYYELDGRDDPHRIVFRKGSYTPSFESAPSPQVPGRPLTRKFWIWGLAGAALASALAGAILLREPSPPLIAVVPWGEAGDREFADGLGEAVAAELSRNSSVRVVPWTTLLAYRASHANALTQETGKTAGDLGAEIALALPVRRNGERLRITALLVKPDRNWKEWAMEYDRDANDAFAVQRELARVVSDDVARVLPRIQ